MQLHVRYAFPVSDSVWPVPVHSVNFCWYWHSRVTAVSAQLGSTGNTQTMEMKLSQHNTVLTLASASHHFQAHSQDF